MQRTSRGSYRNTEEQVSASFKTRSLQISFRKSLLLWIIKVQRDWRDPYTTKGLLWIQIGLLSFVLQGVVRLRKQELPIGNTYVASLLGSLLLIMTWNNSLLRAAKEALTEGSKKHFEIVDEIRDDHLGAARALVKDSEILAQLEAQIEKECRKLRSFLQAAEVGRVMVTFSCDMVIKHFS